MDHQAKKGRKTVRRTEAREASRTLGLMLTAWLSKSQANVIRRRDLARKAAALAGQDPQAHHPHNDRQAVLGRREIVAVQATPGRNRSERRSSRHRSDWRWVEGRRVWPTPAGTNTTYYAPRADAGPDRA